MISRSERSEIQKRFLDEIGERVAIWGFNTKPSGQSFYRKVPSGKWAFHISFIPHKDDLDLTADVAVRNEAIEGVVSKYDSKLNFVESRKSMTLGTELGNLSMGKPLRWKLFEPSDISSVAEKVLEAFEKIGLPFLHSYSELENIYKTLSNSESATMQLAPFLGPRYMRAISAAYLLGRRHEISPLIRDYEEQLERSGDLYLEDFKILSRSLIERGSTGS